MEEAGRHHLHDMVKDSVACNGTQQCHELPYRTHGVGPNITSVAFWNKRIPGCNHEGALYKVRDTKK